MSGAGGYGLPLDGVRVLDLTRLLPGAYCTLLLADLGAEVLKVEDTGLGDYMRWVPPYVGGKEAQERGAASAPFAALNRNKRAIKLDLKAEPARDVLLRLAREHDVLVESFRPGVLDRLGVGYERLAQENPGLVYCAISGYGQDGPLRDRAGHDLNYLARNGLLALSGDGDGPPVQAAGQIADLGGGGEMAAFAIAAALVERARSGRGRLLDVSMTDGAMSWLAMPAAHELATGEGLRRGQVELAGAWICYRPYAASDGWVALGAVEPKFWQAFCEGVERPDLLAHQFDRPGGEAHRQVEEIFRTRTRDQWVAFAEQHDCCLEPVLDLGEALASELVESREMILTVEQPGAGPVRQLASPLKIDGRRPARAEPAPAFGEHTGEVLASLGYDEQEIARLRETGAVG
jgi:crotonobetainyl-CoA:carnitine CoA-transferase CaiB-like acyl-CoA transferase